ncbi:MAG: hypothetical protein ACYTHM_11470 [Planctomycetota bacterium]|jgi:hypothetical protein
MASGMLIFASALLILGLCITYVAAFRAVMEIYDENRLLGLALLFVPYLAILVIITHWHILGKYAVPWLVGVTLTAVSLILYPEFVEIVF